MATWQIEYGYGGGQVNAGVDSRNVIGSALTSVSMVAEHVAGCNVVPSGVFRFTMVSGTTLSVVAADYLDALSPILFSGVKTVVADGATGNIDVIPGLSLVFSAASAASDSFEIGIGCYWDSAMSIWVRATPMDLCFSGVTSDERTLYAHNVSASTQCNSQVVVTNAMRTKNTQSGQRPFKSFRQTGVLNPTAHTDMSGVAVSFANYVPSPASVDILVDGSTIDVYDVTNDALVSGGVGLLCDGTTVYRFDDSTDYCSGEFVLASTLVVTDTAIIYVSDGSEFVEIATDGAFVDGPSGLYLTEQDAPEGVVSADESIAFKIRLTPPAGKTGDLNQRLFSIRIESDGI